jgi:hypothetical protein
VLHARLDATPADLRGRATGGLPRGMTGGAGLGEDDGLAVEATGSDEVDLERLAAADVDLARERFAADAAAEERGGGRQFTGRGRFGELRGEEEDEQRER